MQLEKFEITSDLRDRVRTLRMKGLTIGLVPTMGYLHEGHLSLVRIAKQHSDWVVVSLFVNPTQFNDKKDFEKYPVDLDHDCKLLDEARADAAFIPKVNEVYGENFESWVELDNLPKRYEGEFRPGHFKGVSTVVSILFNQVLPDVAVFGEKDFQQLRIVEKMVKDLHFPIRIERGPTVREPSGLAMSSRNVRLSEGGRKIAAEISRGLAKARQATLRGERSSADVREIAVSHLKEFAEIKLEYANIISEKTFSEAEKISEDARFVIAAWLEGVRLIDNTPLY